MSAVYDAQRSVIHAGSPGGYGFDRRSKGKGKSKGWDDYGSSSYGGYGGSSYGSKDKGGGKSKGKGWEDRSYGGCPPLRSSL